VLEVNQIPKYRNVYSWGGEVDNLGREVDENEHGPVGIDALNEQPLLQIAVGTHHALALTSTGEVISWGIYKDKDGPIGFKPHLSADELQDHPDVMTELEEYKIIQIASSCSRSLALSETGEVFEWGDTKMKKKTLDRHKKEMLLPSNVLIPHKIVALYAEANGETCFAETVKGKILAWGRNQYYQCGVDPEVKPSEKVSNRVVAERNAKEKRKKLATHTRPTSAKQINTVLDEAEDKVEKISSGRLHTVMLTEKGDVYTWGNNKMGQLGQGVDLTETVAVPTKLKFKGLKGKIIDVASGPFHTLLLTDKGEVYGFGGNKNGCLGELDEFQNRPAKISFKENSHMRGKIVGIACGSRHNLIASSKD
jgi:alpha-tubulin suppressor-like RCC1 family protein